ncbi:YciI family protein [Actinokineospora pegani]|uniref:YciI family protein n=1 Tax=Actinokineospora pegani TaxID=2654637 RepID=UPI0012EAC5CA|nr:YciI family protein [Actinokineospora pegani]
MKFLLIMHMNPAVWDGLTEAERKAVMAGHEGFITEVTESGELLGTQALGDPSTSAVVRVRDGVPVVTDGPYAEVKEYLGGFYHIDVDSRERALELAAKIPDAAVDGLGVEVRPVMFAAGPDL